MAPYDPAIHHRHSLRLKGYDYAEAGAYFVTVCAQHRHLLFGEIVDGAMRLNEAGEIVAASWEWLSDRYPHVELDESIVMPNHFHGILVIKESSAAYYRRGGSRAAPTTIAIGKPLGQLVGAFKTASTKRINIVRGTPGVPIWQRNYYEHVIRNERDLEEIREYIVNNPLRWELDSLHPDRSGRL